MENKKLRVIDLNSECLSVKSILNSYNEMLPYINKKNFDYKKLIKKILLGCPLVSVAHNLQKLTPLIEYVKNNREWADKEGVTKIFKEAISFYKDIVLSEESFAVDIIVPYLKYYPDNLGNSLHLDDRKTYKKFISLIRDLECVDTINYSYNTMLFSLLEGHISQVPLIRDKDDVVHKHYSNSKILTNVNTYYMLWQDLIGTDQVYVMSFGEIASNQGYLSIEEIENILK